LGKGPQESVSSVVVGRINVNTVIKEMDDWNGFEPDNNGWAYLIICMEVSAKAAAVFVCDEGSSASIR